jgi:hypothetical protein
MLARLKMIGKYEKHIKFLLGLVLPSNYVDLQLSHTTELIKLRLQLLSIEHWIIHKKSKPVVERIVGYVVNNDDLGNVNLVMPPSDNF